MRRIIYSTLFFLPVLVSCSVQKQIGKEARKNVINSKPLKSAHVGISIFDPATNETLFDFQGDKFFVPASNTKIPTCFVAMKYLGDSLAGIRYQEQDPNTILIDPTGDPTFLMAEFKTNPVFDLLKKYKYILYRTTMFEDHLGSGWAWNDYDEAYMARRSELPIYGNIARFRLEGGKLVVSPKFFAEATTVPYEGMSNGFRIEKPWDPNTFLVLEGANTSKNIPFTPDFRTIADLLEDTLGSIVTIDPVADMKNPKILHSQPVDSMLRPMMHRSDNFYAEQSLLMVSDRLLNEFNDFRVIDTILKSDFRDLPQIPRWVDGSGLSRYNLFTPHSIVSILNKMRNEFGMERIKTIFPTGGRGTLSNYYLSESGYIFAKTGTLSGVVALSGFLYTKKNRLLIFSVLVNNHRSSATDVRRAVESFLKEIREKY